MTVEEAAGAINAGLAGAKATAAKHVWEKMPGGWKYIVSVHGIVAGGQPVLHTKFILWADETRQELKKNVLTYLHELNCVFRTVEAGDAAAITARVQEIVAAGLFGKQLKAMSSVMLEGMSSVNAALVKDGVRQPTVLSMKYVPRYEISPCAETVFGFKLQLSPDAEASVTASYDASTGAWRCATSVADAKDAAEVGEADELPFAIAKQLKKLLLRA